MLAQANLRLGVEGDLILLCPPPKCWDCSHMPLCLALLHSIALQSLLSGCRHHVIYPEEMTLKHGHDAVSAGPSAETLGLSFLSCTLFLS